MKLGVVTSPGYFLSSRQSCMSQSSGSDEMNDWPVCSICKVKKKYAYFIVSYFFTLLLFFFSKHRPEFGTHATTWRGVRVRGLSRLRCLERVRVWCLAQGYHGSAQEVNWHQFFFHLRISCSYLQRLWFLFQGVHHLAPHVFTVAQKGKVKHWLYRGHFAFYVF